MNTINKLERTFYIVSTFFFLLFIININLASSHREEYLIAYIIILGSAYLLIIASDLEKISNYYKIVKNNVWVREVNNDIYFFKSKNQLIINNKEKSKNLSWKISKGFKFMEISNKIYKIENLSKDQLTLFDISENRRIELYPLKEQTSTETKEVVTI